LAVQAFNNMHKTTGVSSNATLAMVLDQGEAGETAANLSALQGIPPTPGSISQLPTETRPTFTTQKQIDDAAPGTKFIWTDGKPYTTKL